MVADVTPWRVRGSEVQVVPSEANGVISVLSLTRRRMQISPLLLVDVVETAVFPVSV